MTTLEDIRSALLQFRDERDWKQFHSLKNLIVSLNLEAAEVLELVQWKTDAALETLAAEEKFRNALGEECADVLSYLILVCDACGIDLLSAAAEKIEKNRLRYPVELSRGSASKYDRLTSPAKASTPGPGNATGCGSGPAGAAVPEPSRNS